MRSLQPHDSSCKRAYSFSLDVKASVTSTRLDAFLDSDKQAGPTWNRTRRCKDQSAEAYHLNLNRLARKAGWEDQEVVDLCITWRRKHGEDLKLRHDYYARLLAKVDAEFEREQLLVRIDNGETLSCDDALQQLSSLLGVSVTSIQRFMTDPRSYIMSLGNGNSIEFSTASEMTSQKKLSGALIDYANIIMSAFNNAEWKNVLRCMTGCIENVETSFESTHLGACIGWLKTYLRRHLRPWNEREGQIRGAIEGKPALIDDEIWFSMDSFKRSILLESAENPPAKGMLSVRLKQIGCEYVKQKALSLPKSSDTEKSYHTSRGLWRAPNDLTRALMKELGIPPRA